MAQYYDTPWLSFRNLVTAATADGAEGLGGGGDGWLRSEVLDADFLHPSTLGHKVRCSARAGLGKGCMAGRLRTARHSAAPALLLLLLSHCQMMADLAVWLLQQAAIDLVLFPYGVEDEAGLAAASPLPPPMVPGTLRRQQGRHLWGRACDTRLTCIPAWLNNARRQPPPAPQRVHPLPRAARLRAVVRPRLADGERGRRRQAQGAVLL